MDRRAQAGAGTVEYIALTALLLAALSALLGAALESNESETRALASRIGIKIRCAARLPEPCWRDPLTDAYGRAVAGLVRAWAADPPAIAGLVPVDPRRCRQASCAIGADDRLTRSNRRITLFSEVTDRRRRDGTIVVTYHGFRPTQGWSVTSRIADRSDVAALARTPLLDSATPQVIPLESTWSVAQELTSARSGTP